jgi:xanthine/CO dehydrogenase XdhC/CoxF family maturation factor
MSEIFEIARAALRRDYSRGVLITLTAVDGSSYRRPGARMLITDHGRSTGAVSGGCLDTALREHAAEVMARSGAHFLDLDTTADTDVLFGHGLGCPGTLRFLIEAFGAAEVPDALLRVAECADRRVPMIIESRLAGEVVFRQQLLPPIRLIVAGAGNDAAPIAAMARELSWEVVVVDPREAFASRFEGAIVAGPEDLLKTISVDIRTAALLTTHHYIRDLEFLRALCGTEARYIGVVGSKKRFESLLHELEEEGTTLDRSRLFGPVGLDLGSETPAEIALAALAEIKAAFEERDGRPLRDKRAAGTFAACPTER